MLQLETQTVAKKKTETPERKTRAVKLDAILARKARTVCEDSGRDMSDYLSDLVRAAVEKDWVKVMKRINAEGAD